MENYNLRPFFTGLVICGLGAILVIGMMSSTSWISYDSSDHEVVQEEFGVATLDYTTEMEIGLREINFDQRAEVCYVDEDEHRACENFDESSTDPILEFASPFASETGSIDCVNPQGQEEKEKCEMESAGYTGHSIILGGLVTLALTFALACIGIFGYIPGWVLKLLGSLAAITILVGAVTWLVMSPDLNSDIGPGEDKWHLSYAFYLTLLGAPIIFVGGFVWGNMDDFASEYEEDDWADEEEHDEQGSVSLQIFTSGVRGWVPA